MHKNTRIASFDLEDRKTMLKSNSNNGLHADMPITAKTSVMIVGFDWGTNKSCIQASFAGSDEPVVSQIVPTVVGYANEGIVENLLPGNAKVLFGGMALNDYAFVDACYAVAPDLGSYFDKTQRVQRLCSWLSEILKQAGAEILSMETQEHNLERLFLELTGRRLRD